VRVVLVPHNVAITDPVSRGAAARDYLARAAIGLSAERLQIDMLEELGA
jgi:hypothetical protein